MTEFDITIQGRPIPFKRTTQRQKWVDKSYHKYRDYKTHVRDTISEAVDGSFEGATVRVSVNVYLSGGGMFSMGRDGDIDNYIKTALDSMNKVVFGGDRNTVSLSIHNLGYVVHQDFRKKLRGLLRKVCHR